jgi:hypothetical protein
MTPTEMWGLFFKYAANPKHDKLLEKICSARSEIKMATEILRSISRDADERARYRMRRKFEMDEANNLIEAREGGRNDVLTLLRKGYTLEQIERELEKLRHSAQ